MNWVNLSNDLMMLVIKIIRITLRTLQSFKIIRIKIKSKRRFKHREAESFMKVSNFLRPSQVFKEGHQELTLSKTYQLMWVTNKMMTDKICIHHLDLTLISLNWWKTKVLPIPFCKDSRHSNRGQKSTTKDDFCPQWRFH